jgi:microcystin-dependent protein
MDPFVGEIRIFAGNFAPRGWALCNGQLLSIAQHTALFSLLGTTYGGDGRVAFALPDLQGRAPMHWGEGPGLTSRTLGEADGSESVTLSQTQLPAHTHAVGAVAAAGDAKSPAGAVLADAPVYASHPSTMLAPQTVAPAGASQAHNNMMPSLALQFIIALEGIFPPRG